VFRTLKTPELQPETKKDLPVVYTCPICSFVFKVESESHRGVVCPGCNFLLRVGEESLNNLSPDRKAYSRAAAKVIGWDLEEEEQISERGGQTVLLVLLIIGFISLSGFIGWSLVGGKERATPVMLNTLGAAAGDTEKETVVEAVKSRVISQCG